MWLIEVGDIAPSLEIKIWEAGSRMILLPATMAPSQSPLRIPLIAKCSAYIEEEQAVFIVTLFKRLIIFDLFECQKYV